MDRTRTSRRGASGRESRRSGSEQRAEVASRLAISSPLPSTKPMLGGPEDWSVSVKSKEAARDERDFARVLEGDTMHEECGVFGIYGPGEDVARLTFFGLYALQHRGQESAGIATADGEGISIYTDMGLVSQIFSEDELNELRKGHLAIGHTRYSTTGSSCVENAQPIRVESDLGPLALAHNGNLVNTRYLADILAERGERVESTTDSELIAWLLATAPGRDWVERIRHTMPFIKGAYSLT